jgi:hypothetical protein
MASRHFVGEVLTMAAFGKQITPAGRRRRGWHRLIFGNAGGRLAELADPRANQPASV